MKPRGIIDHFILHSAFVEELQWVNDEEWRDERYPEEIFWNRCKHEVRVLWYLLRTLIMIIVQEMLRLAQFFVFPELADLFRASFRPEGHCEIVLVDFSGRNEVNEVMQDLAQDDCRNAEQLKEGPELPFLDHCIHFFTFFFSELNQA